MLGKVLDHLLGTREERDSQFLYVPKDALGLPSDGQLALVEVLRKLRHFSDLLAHFAALRQPPCAVWYP